MSKQKCWLRQRAGIYGLLWDALEQLADKIFAEKAETTTQQGGKK